VGCYHTYPHIGGPYEGLQEAENAIERYLDDRRHLEMHSLSTSFLELQPPCLSELVNSSLYTWLDSNKSSSYYFVFPQLL
jgi:hypothetical protein